MPLEFDKLQITLNLFDRGISILKIGYGQFNVVVASPITTVKKVNDLCEYRS